MKEVWILGLPHEKNIESKPVTFRHLLFLQFLKDLSFYQAGSRRIFGYYNVQAGVGSLAGILIVPRERNRSDNFQNHQRLFSEQFFSFLLTFISPLLLLPNRKYITRFLSYTENPSAGMHRHTGNTCVKVQFVWPGQNLHRILGGQNFWQFCVSLALIWQ